MALSDLIASRTPAPLEELSVPVGPAEAVIPATIADEGSSSGVTTLPSQETVTSDPETDAAKSDTAIEAIPLDSQIPRGVAESVTPSGIQIYFQAGPKRLYKLNGKEVPSMSDVLSILDKPALVWWGMKVGVEGFQKLMEEGFLSYELGIWWVNPDRLDHSATADDIVALLTEHKLTVNHVRDKAADRGTNVHDAFEIWATQGIMPRPELYGAEERGYVEALIAFLVDSGVEAQAAEVMVGSTKLKFAGRFDLRGTIPNNAEVVVKTYPKRKPLRAPLQGGDWLLDVKTSKGTYPTHALQLAGYELASVESGYEPTVAQGVVHLTADGRYELVRSNATATDFRAIRKAYGVMQKELLG